MDAIQRLLFEEPLQVYIALAVLEAATVAVWMSRRTRAWLYPVIAIPLVGVAVGLAARLVVTDRERIAEALETVAARVEKKDIDSAGEFLDAKFRAGGPLGLPINKAAMIALGKAQTQIYPVRKVVVSRVETEVAGVNATSHVDTRLYFAPAAGGTGREFLDIGWLVQWAKRPEGWRVTRLEITSPQELTGMIR